MNEIIKSKCTRMLSALLAVLIIITMLPASAFAWSAEEGTNCTSVTGELYTGSDGKNFYFKPTVKVLIYRDDGSYYVKTYSSGAARHKYYLTDSNGRHFVYCIEAGIDFADHDSYLSSSGKNSRFFQNLPVNAQFGIMIALMYGYHEGLTSPVPGTNNDDFAFATQCIIWEYQQQLRTSPTSIASNNGIDADMYNHTIIGRPAELCYNWILEQMSRHYVVPSFSSRNQSNAQTYTMKYDQAKANYSITLTDANNTMADINFSESDITVTRSGNQYTFTCKNKISDAVTISAQKKINLGMGKMLIWGCPGKQTMASGADDPVFFYFKLNTETTGVGHIMKTSEDGKVEGIKFTITGNGVNETVTTDKNGTVDLDLLPGTYSVRELPDDKYETQAVQTVTIVSGKTSTVTFNNTLRRGDLKVTKTAEDGLIEGVKFHLYGTSYCGLPVDEYAVTNASGVAVFDDLLIGTSYTLEEVDTPHQYVIPDKLTATIEWNTVTELNVLNRLIHGTVKGYKVNRETGDKISGALFGLFRADETSFTEDNAFLTAESGEDGIFTFVNVVYGNYTVRELRPAAGYLENENTYPVTVDKDGEVVEITVVNDLIPEIGTTATVDDEKEVCATEVFTLTDTVEYKHLVPGKEYTVKGILMDKATGEPFLQNGEQITSEVIFVPEAPSGSVEVLFTFDAKLIKTDTSIVVFESLYSDGKELTVHADIEDEDQTVTVVVPKIKTEASADGKKETTIGGEITIEDIVSYHNLTPGKEYVVKGTLMNKATGKPVTVNDEPVTAEAAFTPESRNGEVKVSFTFNSYVITETTDVVVFENLYREDVEIAVHADIEDEGQSVKVYVPEIKTTASIDGKKEVTTAGKVTIEDVVSYTNLIQGTEYTIHGTLMNKATGEVFTVNGETITADVKFTPKDRNGEVKVKFVFDASSITTSTKLVVFEGLYREDVEITTHKDIEDQDQTVTITPPPDIPKTGDSTNIPLWGAITGLSLLGAGVVAFFTFRKKKEENGHER